MCGRMSPKSNAKIEDKWEYYGNFHKVTTVIAKKKIKIK